MIYNYGWAIMNFFCILNVHQIMIMITVMMLQLRYGQPCMNDLTKPGEVAVNMIKQYKQYSV